MRNSRLLFQLATAAGLFATVAAAAPVSRIVFGTQLTALSASGSLVAADADGNTYLGYTNEVFVDRLLHDGGPYTAYYPFVEKISRDGHVAFTNALQGGLINAIAVSPAGNVVIAGLVAVSPMIPPIQATAGALQTNAASSGFVAQFAPDGTLVFVATLPVVNLSAVAIDSLVAIYVTGGARSDFQTTPGSFQGSVPACPSYCSNAFVAKISPDGSQLIYATFLGGTGIDSGVGIAVDSTRSVYVAGNTTSEDFPTTTTVQSNGGAPGGVFVAQLDPAGSKLLFSSILGGSSADLAVALAVDSSGAAYVVGTSSNNLDYGANDVAYQSVCPGALTPFVTDAFLTKFDSTGEMVFATCWGSGYESARGVLIDANGRLLVDVNSFQPTPDYHAAAGPFYSSVARRAAQTCDAFDTVLVIDRDTGSISDFEGLIGFDYTGVSMALDGSGLLHVTGDAGNNGVFAYTGDNPYAFNSYLQVVRLDLSLTDVFLPSCVVNSASQWFAIATTQPQGAGSFIRAAVLGPGELISIYGAGLGPSDGITAAPDLALPQVLGAVQVTLDGNPLPLLFVSAERIDAVVPYSLQNPNVASLTIQNGNLTASYSFLTGPISAGIITRDGSGAGQASALNEDGTVNSLENPAARGSIVSLFATGLGALSPPMPDNARTPLLPPFSTVANPPTIYCAGLAPNILMPVQYAGVAPGAPPGVYQVNVQIPAGAAAGTSNLNTIPFFPSAAWIAVK